MEPVPSCPLPPAPQHQTAPFESTAQTVTSPFVPAPPEIDTCTAFVRAGPVIDVTTSTGVVLGVVDALPSWPVVFRPPAVFQHHTFPALTAHETPAPVESPPPSPLTAKAVATIGVPFANVTSVGGFVRTPAAAALGA